jgi:hypothetical protein
VVSSDWTSIQNAIPHRFEFLCDICDFTAKAELRREIEQFPSLTISRSLFESIRPIIRQIAQFGLAKQL